MIPAGLIILQVLYYIMANKNFFSDFNVTFFDNLIEIEVRTVKYSLRKHNTFSLNLVYFRVHMIQMRSYSP